MLKLHVMATDLLLWILFLLCFIYFFWAKRQYLHCQAWCNIALSSGSCCALISCGFFMLIALLDSVHFLIVDPNSALVGKIYSVLDFMFYGFFKSEVTYSEPFATKLFVSLYNSANLAELKYVSPLMLVGWFKLFCLSLLLSLIIVFVVSLLFNFRDFKKFKVPFLCFFIWVFLIVLVAFLLPHYHLFGTDQVGGDVFYQCVKSIRTGVVIGGVSMLFMLPFAIFFGLSAGYFGGVVDDAIQFLYTVLSAIPAVLLIAAAVLVLDIFISSHGNLFLGSSDRADFKLLGLCLILGVTGWTPLARLLRAETFKLKNMAFIQAAKLMQVNQITIVFRHLLPNVMHLILMTVVLDFSGLVLAEAVLSYVGVGVDASTNSWGNIINAARLELARDPIVWWPVLGAFIMMFSLVLSMNVLADALRKNFSPKEF